MTIKTNSRSVGHSPQGLRVIVAWFAGLILTSTGFAQNVDRIAEREVQRREVALSRGQEALVLARAAMAERNFRTAHNAFRDAVGLLPNAVISGSAHNEAMSGFCESAVRLAEQRIAEGKYAEAESLIREILDPGYDPNYRP